MRIPSSLLISLALIGVVSCKSTTTDPGNNATPNNVAQLTVGSTFTFSKLENGATTTTVDTVVERGVTYQGQSNAVHIRARNSSNDVKDGYVAFDASGDMQSWAPLNVTSLGLQPTWVRFPFMSGSPFHLSQQGSLNGQAITVAYDITKTSPSSITIKGVTYPTQTAHLTLSITGQGQATTTSQANYAFSPELGYVVKSTVLDIRGIPVMDATMIDASKK